MGNKSMHAIIMESTRSCALHVAPNFSCTLHRLDSVREWLLYGTIFSGTIISNILAREGRHHILTTEEHTNQSPTHTASSEATLQIAELAQTLGKELGL